MNELSLFTGAGGLLVGRQLGWHPVCAVELDLYARSVLIARQDDGSLPPFPIWDDVRTFDGHPWRGHVDIVTGGFPCQDISSAGTKAGISGTRSGLWKEMARVVREVRPRFVFVENSPYLNTRGLDVVLGDLAALGFDAEWGVLGAEQVGAPHKRERTWIVAHSDANCERQLQQGGPINEERRWPGDLGGEQQRGALADANGVGAQVPAQRELPAIQVPERDQWWATEPIVGRMADGVAARVDRLKCLGNGQVPQCAATAFTALARRGGWIR